MAAGTAVALGGLVLSGYQTVKGIQQSKKAENARKNFNRQDLYNTKENIPISTTGSGLLREENARASASALDVARGAGSRGIFGLVPTVQAQTNLANEKARAYLDDQIQNRDYAIANDNVRIQQMQEARDNQELAGIGQLYQTGQQNTFEGMKGMFNAGASAVSQLGTTEDAVRPKAESVMKGSPIIAQGVSDSLNGTISAPSLPKYIPSDGRLYNEGVKLYKPKITTGLTSIPSLYLPKYGLD